MPDISPDDWQDFDEARSELATLVGLLANIRELHLTSQSTFGLYFALWRIVDRFSRVLDRPEEEVPIPQPGPA